MLHQQAHVVPILRVKWGYEKRSKRAKQTSMNHWLWI